MTWPRVFLVVVLLVSATASGAWDALAGATPPRGDVSGPLLGNSTPGRAVLNADGLTPGAKRSGSLTIVNHGDDSTITLRAAVRDAAGPRGGRLSDELEFEVRSVGTRSEPARVIWSGRLVDGAIVAELAFPGGSTRSLRLIATLPPDAGDEIQGARTWFELRWSR